MKKELTLEQKIRKYERDKAWRLANPEKIKAYHKKHYYNNKEARRRLGREYSKNNREKCSAMAKSWRIRNPGKLLEYQRRYVNKNRAMFQAANRARKSRVKEATPPWLTLEMRKEIEQFYLNSQFLTWWLDIKFNVDHIVPLQGENVCGLHVPWNLQVMEQSHNYSKHNKLGELHDSC